MVSVYEQLANRSKFFEDRRMTELFHRSCPAAFRRKYTGDRRPESGRRITVNFCASSGKYWNVKEARLITVTL